MIPGNMIRFLTTLPLLYSLGNALPLGVDSTAIITPFSNVDKIASQKLGQIIGSKTFTFVEPFPDSGRKKAILEQESKVSQIDTAYGNLQNFVASFYGPKPVLDTIQEHQKYGNDGGKIRAAGVAVIGGIEALSNLGNAAVDLPFEAAAQIGRKFSDSFNTLGGKISGIRR